MTLCLSFRSIPKGITAREGWRPNWDCPSSSNRSTSHFFLGGNRKTALFFAHYHCHYYSGGRTCFLYLQSRESLQSNGKNHELRVKNRVEENKKLVCSGLFEQLQSDNYNKTVVWLFCTIFVHNLSLKDVKTTNKKKSIENFSVMSVNWWCP